MIEQSLHEQVTADIAAGRTKPEDYELAKSIGRRGVYRARELDHITKYRIGKERLSADQKRERKARDERRRAGYEQYSREELASQGLLAGSRGAEGISRGPTIIRGGFTQGTGARGGFGQPSTQEVVWESRSQQVQRQTREAIRQRYTQAYGAKLASRGVGGLPGHTQTRYQRTPTYQEGHVRDPRQIPYSKVPLKQQRRLGFSEEREQREYREELEDPKRYLDPESTEGKFQIAMSQRFGFGAIKRPTIKKKTLPGGQEVETVEYERRPYQGLQQVRWGRMNDEEQGKVVTTIVTGGAPGMFGPSKRTQKRAETKIKQKEQRTIVKQKEFYDLPAGPEAVVFAVDQGPRRAQIEKELYGKKTITPSYIPTPIKKFMDLPTRGYEDFRYKAGVVKTGITREFGPVIERNVPQLRAAVKEDILKARAARQELRALRKEEGVKISYKQTSLRFRESAAEAGAGAGEFLLDPGEVAAEVYTGAATYAALSFAGPLVKPVGKYGGKALEWTGKKLGWKAAQKTPAWLSKHSDKIIGGTFGTIYAGSEGYAIATDPNPWRRAGQTPLRLASFVGGAKGAQKSIQGMETLAYTRVARPRTVISEDPMLTGGRATKYDTRFDTAGEAKVYLEGKDPRTVKVKINERVTPMPELIGPKGEISKPGRDWVSRFRITTEVSGKQPTTQKGYGTIRRGSDQLAADLYYGKKEKASLGMTKIYDSGKKQLWEFGGVHFTKKGRVAESLGGLTSYETFRGMSPVRVPSPERAPREVLIRSGTRAREQLLVEGRPEYGSVIQSDKAVIVRGIERQTKVKQEETVSIYGKTMFGLVPTKLEKGAVIDTSARTLSTWNRWFKTPQKVKTFKVAPYYGVDPKKGALVKTYKGTVITQKYKKTSPLITQKKRTPLLTSYRVPKSYPGGEARAAALDKAVSTQAGQLSLKVVKDSPKYKEAVPKYTGPSPSASLTKFELKRAGKKAFSIRERVYVKQRPKQPKFSPKLVLGGRITQLGKADSTLRQKPITIIGQRQQPKILQEFKIKPFTEQLQDISPKQKFEQKITEKPLTEQIPSTFIEQVIKITPGPFPRGPDPFKPKTPKRPKYWPSLLGPGKGKGYKRRGRLKQKRGFAPSLLGKAYAEYGIIFVSPSIRVPGFGIRGQLQRKPRKKRRKKKR